MRWLLVVTAVLFVPLGQAGELEMLRERCAEQERQIRDLETEVGRLRSEIQQRANEGVIPVGSGEVLDIRRAGKERRTGGGTSKNAYTVKKGDTLTGIARHFGTTVEAIIKRNSISDPSRLVIGDKLEIPLPKKTAPAPVAKPTASPSAAETHTVRKGDTLYHIARSHGTSIASLLKANPELDPARLRIGQVIRLAGSPASKGTQKTDPPAPAPAAKQAEPAEKAAIRLVHISERITFGDFAAKHGVTVEQLNEMNGQNLAATRLLDAGSELYVPRQP